VGVIVTVVDITVGEIGHTDGTVVVTVEGWFITVNRVGRPNHPRHPGKTWI